MGKTLLGETAAQRGHRLLGLFEPQAPSAPLIQQPEEELEQQQFLPGEVPQERVLEGMHSDPLLQHEIQRGARIDDYSEEERAVHKAKLEEQFNPTSQDNASALPAAEGPPAEPDGESNIFRSTVNFLFSDEMGMLGMKWDEDGFDIAMENVKTQLVEHPYATAFTAALYMFPLTAAYLKAGRIATRAADMLGKTAGKRGLLGFKFDDPVDFVRRIATGAEGEGKRFFDDGTWTTGKNMVDAIKHGSDETVAKLFPEKQLKRMLAGDIQMEKALELRNLVKTGTATKAQMGQYRLQKAFHNKYYKRLTEMEGDEIRNLDNFYKDTKFSMLLGAAPAPEAGTAIYKHLMGQVDYKDLAKEIGDDGALWAASIKDHWTDLYKQQVDEGFIDAGSDLHKFFTQKLGGFHLPALKKGTPGALTLPASAKTLKAAAGEVMKKEAADFGMLMGGPTMKHRGKYTEVKTILGDIDQLITDPAELTVGGYIRDAQIFHVYKTFRDIIVDGAGNIDKWKGQLLHADDWDTLTPLAQKEWVDLNMLDEVVPGLADRMMRMISKKMDDTGQTIGGRLPMIDRTLAEQFFGEGGALAMSKINGGIFDIFTAVHKTAGTALNPPTHMSNLIGNMSFLAMAGMNPFSAQALNDAKVVTKGFIHVAKQVNKSKGAVSFNELLTKENLIKAFGKDRYIETKLGGKVDLAEMFADDMMKDLVEAQAFESVEGFKHIQDTLKRLEAMEATSKGASYSQKAAKKVAQAVVGFGEAPGIKRILKVMSSSYLAEDMVPKQMYAMHLARNGWGSESILKEVGRRLPQYKTVGNLPAATRRVLLPWITFPAEATRILKNNMLDNPIRTSLWMNITPLLQGVASHAEAMPGYPLDDLTGIKKQLPPWADRANTLMMKGEAAPEVAGALQGTAWGGAVGAAVGGARGAAIGAATGAAGMAGLQRAFGHDEADASRALVLDFLPYSTMTPGSLSEGELTKLDPMTPSQGGDIALDALIDISPVEPLAILLPALDIYSGRGPFGAEIRTDSLLQQVSKQMIGLMGILSPPIMQKYGMKLTGEEKNVFNMADIFEANGSQMSHPKEVQGTFAGLAVGGLTALGMKRMGMPTGTALKAGAAVGALGGLGGREINMQRLAVDLGMEVDPRTGQKGSWTSDFIGNSLLGVAKSWKATPEQQLFTEGRAAGNYQKVRGTITRRFNYAISQNDQTAARKEMGQVYQTFFQEHGNAAVAREKFDDWMTSNIEGQYGLPGLKGFSDETLEMRRKLAMSAFKANGKESDRLVLQAILSEQHMRNKRNMSGVKFVDEKYKTNVYTPKKAKRGLYE